MRWRAKSSTMPFVNAANWLKKQVRAGKQIVQIPELWGFDRTTRRCDASLSSSPVDMSPCFWFQGNSCWDSSLSRTGSWKFHNEKWRKRTPHVKKPYGKNTCRKNRLKSTLDQYQSPWNPQTYALIQINAVAAWTLPTKVLRKAKLKTSKHFDTELVRSPRIRDKVESCALWSHSVLPTGWLRRTEWAIVFYASFPCRKGWKRHDETREERRRLTVWNSQQTSKSDIGRLRRFRMNAKSSLSSIRDYP